VREHEKKDGQLFLFNIIIYIGDADFTESDKLESTLSYSDVIREIRRINDNERFDLLETFCQALAASIARMSKLVER
jgi:dihydroneopterin aldolase